MPQNLCPKCSKQLTWDGKYHCVHCQVHYQKLAFCADCGARLEKLQACGAVSYFCNHSCNELKSKSTARFEFRVLD
ncbi:zinc ribbon domain-containing protein [Vibrio rarus]|uniref:zinc ribbon domain-containing protein n=1 Tax=Vibrio rarus TaxID=413403 RepID=UPI0021C2D06B|nr:zinc ribbon domain-containing protein [Vibrio rarus]